MTNIKKLLQTQFQDLDVQVSLVGKKCRIEIKNKNTWNSISLLQKLEIQSEVIKITTPYKNQDYQYSLAFKLPLAS